MPDASYGEKIEIAHGPENTTNAIIQFLGNASDKVDNVVDKSWASVVSENGVYKQAIIDYGRRGVRARIITEITKDNLNYCKEIVSFAKLAEIRHPDGVKG